MLKTNEVEFITMHLGQTKIEVHPDAVKDHMKAGWQFGSPDPVPGATPAGASSKNQVVELVAMEKGGNTIDVHPSALDAHKKQGWTIIDQAPDQAGKVPLKELIRLAQEWHRAWAAERAKEGWNDQEILFGRKAPVLETQLVEVSKGKETLKVNQAALEAHILAGWTPKAKAVDMRSPIGDVIPIRTNSIESLLEKGWKIADTAKEITPAIDSPLVPMWKDSERIEVHVSAVLQHAARGWSIEELELVIKDGQVKEIPCIVEDAYFGQGWELLVGLNPSKSHKSESEKKTATSNRSLNRSKVG
jgi:hypothetical protein